MKPMRFVWIILAGLGLPGWEPPAWAALTPEAKCEAGKNIEIGELAYCMQKANAKLLKLEGACAATASIECHVDDDCPAGEVCVKDTSKFDAAVLKCEAKYTNQWQKLEDSAADKGKMCPSQGDAVAVKEFVFQCMDAIATAQSGGELPLGVTDCNEGLADCDQARVNCATNSDACASLLVTCEADVATCRSGTAQAADVRTAKTFSSSAGIGATGTMPEVGEQRIVPGVSPVLILPGYHDDTGAVAGDADLTAANIMVGSNIFGQAGSAALAQPPKTGQGTCYIGDTVIPCVDGSGQDGATQYGIARSFTDNGDGTITDNITGLMWEKLANDGSIHAWGTEYTWYNAFTKIASLNASGFAGYTDWRLPNVVELASLANHGQAYPATYPEFDAPNHGSCPTGCTVEECSCTWAHVHWTSSTTVNTPANAWSVDFILGSQGSPRKTTVAAVRAVRAGID